MAHFRTMLFCANVAGCATTAAVPLPKPAAAPSAQAPALVPAPWPELAPNLAPAAVLASAAFAPAPVPASVPPLSPALAVGAASMLVPAPGSSPTLAPATEWTPARALADGKDSKGANCGGKVYSTEDMLKVFKCVWEGDGKRGAVTACNSDFGQNCCPVMTQIYGQFQDSQADKGNKLSWQVTLDEVNAEKLGPLSELLLQLLGNMETLLDFIGSALHVKEVVKGFFSIATALRVGAAAIGADYDAAVKESQDAVRGVLFLPDCVAVPAPHELVDWISDPVAQVWTSLEGCEQEVVGKFLGIPKEQIPSPHALKTEYNNGGPEDGEPSTDSVKLASLAVRKTMGGVQMLQRAVSYSEGDAKMELQGWHDLFASFGIATDVWKSINDACGCEEGCEAAEMDCTSNIRLGGRPQSAWTSAVFGSFKNGMCVDAWMPALWDMELQKCATEYSYCSYADRRADKCHDKDTGNPNAQCPEWPATPHTRTWWFYYPEMLILPGCACSEGFKQAKGISYSLFGRPCALNWFAGSCNTGYCERCTDFEKYPHHITKNGHVSPDLSQFIKAWRLSGSMVKPSEMEPFSSWSAWAYMTLAFVTSGGLIAFRLKWAGVRYSVVQETAPASLAINDDLCE